MKRLYIMRHGQTDMNVGNLLQGQIDCPLNEVGIEQAKDAGERFRKAGLKFDNVYSSPLSRALDTAVYASGVPAEEIVIDERIIEQGFGPFEGANYENFDEAMWDWLRDPDNVPTPEGIEPTAELVARTGDFVNSFAAGDVEGDTLIVTHGVAIRAIMGNICGKEKAVWGMPIPNCVLYMTEIVDGEFTEPEMIEI